MKPSNSEWLPGGYERYRPDRANPSKIFVKRVNLSTKEGRPPLLILGLEVWSLKDSTRLWMGSSFHPFGVSDRLDERSGALVEFLHEAADLKLRGNPDWKSLSVAVRWRRFIGSLQRNRDYINLMSLQCWGDTIEDQGSPIVWSMDGRCFSGADHTSVLVSVEDLLGNGGGSTDFLIEEEIGEAVIEDDEDDEDLLPAQPSEQAGYGRRNRHSVVQVIEDYVDDGL